MSRKSESRRNELEKREDIEANFNFQCKQHPILIFVSTFPSDYKVNNRYTMSSYLEQGLATHNSPYKGYV